MKTKELKKLALKIAEQERVLQTSDNNLDRKRAQEEILRLSSAVQSMEDMMTLDDMLMEMLEKNS